MRIAIMSDHHLGFKGCKYRYLESFENLKECFSIARNEKVDAILMPGDIFDEAIPPLEVWHKTFEVFSEIKKGNSDATVFLKDKKCSYSGIPVIAIHGTHEFRSKGYKNALQVLAESGALIYIHADNAVIEKDSERIAVYGLGGIPEKHALDALRAWNPEPVPDIKNVILLHQSIKEFLPFDDPMTATIGMEDLPKGFDFIFNGHLHWSSNMKNKNSRLVIPGSTIFTQSKKLEAEKGKGFFIWNSKDNSLEFKKLPNQRELVYHKVKFENANAEEVTNKVKELIEAAMQKPHSREPIIRLKLAGTLKKGVSPSNISYDDTLRKYEGKAIFSIDKHFIAPQFKKTIDELRDLQKSRKSIASLGISILEKNLEQTDFKGTFNIQQVFDMLAENKVDEVVEMLSELNYEDKPEKKQAEKVKLTDFT